MAPAKDHDAAIEDFTLAIGALLRRIRATAPAEALDLSLTQRAVLSRLDKGGPATTAELARVESVKPQSMGAAVGTLEELGYVERKPHPVDGRQYNLNLTAKGLAFRKLAREARHIWLAESFAKLDRADQTALFRAGELIKRLAES